MLPTPTSRLHIARKLDQAYNDALVHYLRVGLDLQAARTMAGEIKLQVFAQLIGDTAEHGKPVQ